MPKPKKFTSISEIETSLLSQTKDLYQQTQSVIPQAMPVEQVTTQRKRASKPQSIIPRENGKLLFLEERHNEAIEQIHWTSKVDRQDVIRTAVEDFLHRYFDNERLNAQGEQLIRDYYNRTHR